MYMTSHQSGSGQRYQWVFNCQWRCWSRLCWICEGQWHTLVSPCRGRGWHCSLPLGGGVCCPSCWWCQWLLFRRFCRLCLAHRQRRLRFWTRQASREWSGGGSLCLEFWYLEVQPCRISWRRHQCPSVWSLSHGDETLRGWLFPFIRVDISPDVKDTFEFICFFY